MIMLAIIVFNCVRCKSPLNCQKVCKFTTKTASEEKWNKSFGRHFLIGMLCIWYFYWGGEFVLLLAWMEFFSVLDAQGISDGVFVT